MSIKNSVCGNRIAHVSQTPYILTMSKTDKIKGCFLLGACGDTLGAPIEGYKSLSEITDHFGPEGLGDIIDFPNAYNHGTDLPAGRVTDDTTMLVTTAVALAKAGKDASIETMRENLWQGYVNWVLPQRGGGAAKKNIDPKVKWPDMLPDFWFACGAGHGTIAALIQDKPGTVNVPVDYDVVLDGKQVKSPSHGCGGMMRVAPIGFLDKPPEEIFEIACESAAITHGNPPAYVASGIIALYVHFAAQDMQMKDVLQNTRNILQKFSGNPAYTGGIKTCLKMIDHAEQKALEKPHDMTVMDALPRELGVDRAFNAEPVLAHVPYALCSATENIKSAMMLAVNHGGDSDSVGAIVGNILGARHGEKAVPREWREKLLQNKEITQMAEDFGRFVSDLSTQQAYNRAPPQP